ncbi:sensor histidine kinase [Salinibacterium sp. M195]|uniref:sensor histidine kinase n=1 Tax=Salinibacterium sp. M195 TaxID=2583374 RepID=UPI001C6282EA|nr:histidine kinase [Salinibacterium sp. M195]QYH35952.1 sensor histidine kinase [Salinibacterium sp. M195]
MIRHLSRGALIFDASVALVAVALRYLLGVNEAPLWAVVAILGVAFALRRLSPAIALAAAWLGALAQMVFLLPIDGANLAIIAVLFSAARYGRSWVRRAGLISVVAGSVLGAMYLSVFYWGPTQPDDWATFVWPQSPGEFMSLVGTFVGMTALLGLSWTAGLLARTQAIARESKSARLVAESVAAVELERNQIARDMHDVVAHSLAVVIAQADGARYASAADPAMADSALSTISGTAREALTDVRLLLEQLRHSQSLGPQPGLADISALVEQMRSAGLQIEVVENGPSVELPAGKQIALYRITQEAMTNALRHGDPAAPALLSIEWSGETVTVTMKNRIAKQDSLAEQRTGHGLIGMRERALLTAAQLDVGPEGENFLVRLALPTTQ